MTANAAADLTATYGHLAEDAARIAKLDSRQRRAFLDRDQYVGHPAADYALEQLENLVELPDSIRPRSFILVGESQMGKSAILEEFARQFPASDNPEGEHAAVRVVRIQYPESQGDGVYGEVIRTLNGQIAASAGSGARRAMALTLIANVGMRVFVVDELANVLEWNKKSIAMNSIKYLMNELRRPIVLGATKEAYEIITRDPQILGRFQVLKLPRFMNDEDLAIFLRGWEQVLPLRKPSALDQPVLQTKIWNITGGLTGNIESLLKKAASEAIDAEECISAQLLDELGWVSQRDRVAEVRRM